mmetsp:Transcript_17470/g.32753  ORF Transcript_17470/g.32753 Transcript_17470/m.32753 type:complete len:393 (-) Transcript_17470:508-1686(-)
MTCHLGLVIIVNMKNRIRDAPILRLRGIKVVRHEFVSLIFQCNILQHGILVNRTINIRLRLLAEIDRLGITPALKVKNSILVPPMLIIPNERPMRIGRQRRLTRPAQPEEQRRIPILVHVRRTVHWQLRRILHRKPVIHQRENALLVLASVPRTEYDGALLLDVEYHGYLRVEAVFFPVLVDLGTGVDHREVGFESLEVGGRIGTNEHVRDEVLLPRHLVDEADLALTLRIGTAESIEDVTLLLGVKVIHCLFVQFVKDLGSGRLIDLAPIHIRIALAADILDEPFVSWTSSREFTCIDREGFAVLGGRDLALVVLYLVLEEFLEGLILVDGGWAGDAEFGNACRFAGGWAGVDVGGIVSASDGVFCGGEGGFVSSLGGGGLLVVLLDMMVC